MPLSSLFEAGRSQRSPIDNKKRGFPLENVTAWPRVLLAVACGIVVAMNMGKVPISLPLLRDDFGLSLVEAGWVLSAFNTLAVTTAVFFGVLGARIGALRFCLLGLALCALGTGLGLASNGLAPLLGSRVLEGAGFIAVGVSAPALVSASSALHDRRFTLTVWSCYMPAGAGLITLVAPPLLGVFGWSALWWGVLALLILSLATLIVQRKAYALPVSARQVEGPRGHVLMQASPWLLALAFVVYSIQFFAVTNWLPTFLREQRDYSLAVISLLTALTLFANVFGNLLGGVLMQRHARRGILILGANLIMGIAGAGVFTDALPDGLRYLLCCVLTFVGGVVPASVLSSPALLARTPGHITILQGLYLQGSNVGQFVGPPVIAALVSASGEWRSALAVTLTSALVGMALGWKLRKL